MYWPLIAINTFMQFCMDLLFADKTFLQICMDPLSADNGQYIIFLTLRIHK